MVLDLKSELPTMSYGSRKKSPTQGRYDTSGYAKCAKHASTRSATCIEGVCEVIHQMAYQISRYERCKNKARCQQKLSLSILHLKTGSEVPKNLQLLVFIVTNLTHEMGTKLRLDAIIMSYHITLKLIIAPHVH